MSSATDPQETPYPLGIGGDRERITSPLRAEF